MSIDYIDYTNPFILAPKHGVAISNNTNSYIPFEFIKDIYFTDVKNKDGSLVHFNRDSLFVFESVNNGMYFNSCDKPQHTNSFIELILISGKTLKTTHSREVRVE